jgi:glucose/mannose transport system substrate-binding protein
VANWKTLTGVVVALSFSTAGVSAAPDTSIIHWWTAGGEAAALRILVDAFEKNGGKWKDSPVAGGEAARMVARTRILGGDPPTAMQWQFGNNLFALAEEKLLNDLDDVAKPDGWDKVLPPQIQAQIKYEGKYVIAPLGLHGRNWLWSNTEVFAKVGVAAPKTWAEIDAVAEKIRAAGYIPLALGGQSWQELIVFETVVLEVGGAEMFKKVTALDLDTLGSPKMVDVFRQLEKIKGYLDPGSPGRDWNITAGLLTSGKAALFVHGDWAKGEFAGAGKSPGKDIGCTIFPAGRNVYVYNGDGFAATAVTDADRRKAQTILARTVMDPALQHAFSIRKGSIPSRLDVSVDGFDPCAQAAYAASGAGQLVETGDLVSEPTGWGAIQDTVTAFMHGKQSPEAGVEALVRAVKAAK